MPKILYVAHRLDTFACRALHELKSLNDVNVLELGEYEVAPCDSIMIFSSQGTFASHFVRLVQLADPQKRQIIPPQTATYAQAMIALNKASEQASVLSPRDFTIALVNAHFVLQGQKPPAKKRKPASYNKGCPPAFVRERDRDRMIL